MNINPNDQAFPVSFIEEGRWQINPGLPSLAYFAAHAPVAIPEWFKHEPLPRSENPKFKLESRDRHYINDWEESEGEHPLPEHLLEIGEEIIQYNRAVNTYDRRDKQARYFQWRTYYASQMIAELNKAGV